MKHIENPLPLTVIRQRKKISRNKLAELTGVKLGAIQPWEQRTVDIMNATTHYIIKIAQALECTVEDLIEEVPDIDYELLKKYTTKTATDSAKKCIGTTKLEAYRRAAGLSRLQLSQITSIPIGTIQHFEQEINIIGNTELHTVCRLAKAFGVSVEDIVD